MTEKVIELWAAGFVGCNHLTVENFIVHIE